jgi:hypothetical protein
MAADFPDGELVSGPYCSRLQQSPVDYPADRTIYDDGACDVNVQPCGLIKYVLEYEGLTAAEVTTLRDHYNDARGKTESFNFYHRRDATLYGDVFYESLKLPRRIKIWSNPVTVTLVRFA